MREYGVIFEHGPNNWSAYVPDLPGCVAAAETYEETEQLIREAIAFHIRGLRKSGYTIPEPTARAANIEVEVAA